MRKILITFLVLLCAAFSAQAQHGYRGFIDIAGGLGYGTSYSAGEASGKVVLTTTHGYQFNRHIFAGVGAGIGYSGVASYGGVVGVEAPIYAQFRYDQSLLNACSWYGLARAGIEVGYAEPYGAIEFGVRKAQRAGRLAWNFGLRPEVSLYDGSNFRGGILVCVGIEF